LAEENLVTFNFEDIKIPGFDGLNTREWIHHAINNEGGVLANLQFIFCNDEFLSEINRKYLNHDSLTDIIAFNYNDEYNGIAGDIFISYERVAENAKRYNVTTLHELHRVIIHGVLHLLGYNDKTATQKSQMRAKENYYLNLLS